VTSPGAVGESLAPGLVLLGKADCHLCDVMAAVVERVLAARGGTYRKKDLGEDPRLEVRYRFEIPVLFLDGREIARHRVTEAELGVLLDRGTTAGG
jgi:hypothetical protein